MKHLILIKVRTADPHMTLKFPFVSAAADAKSLQSCLTLCDPIDGSPSGSPSLGFSKPRILEWVAISFSKAFSWPRDRTQVSCIAGGCFTIWVTTADTTAAKLLQSCLTLCDPIDDSPPGSPIAGILQARILEWVAISSPGDFPDPGIEPRSPTLQADSLTSAPPGKWWLSILWCS